MGSLIAATACVLALGGACAREAAPAPVPVGQFTLAYERGGGFAPMPRALAVRPGRRATVIYLDSRNHRRTVEFRLGLKRARHLQAAAERARIGEIEPPVPGTCSDCFVYTVAYRGERLSVEEVDVPERMQPLISSAEAVIEAHLPFH